MNNIGELLEKAIRFIVPFKTDEQIDRYKIRREIRFDKNIKVTIPREVKRVSNNIELSRSINKLLLESIKEFISKIERTVPEKYRNNMYNNLNTLTARFVETCEMEQFSISEYDLLNNKILTTDSDFKEYIDHELLHMASTVVQNGVIYSGVMQTTDKYDMSDSKTYIGAALNEGITEHFSTKYLKDKQRASYMFEKRTAALIEEIVGEDVLMESYFTNNLPKLMDELSKYGDREKCFDLIKAMDYIFGLENKGKINNDVIGKVVTLSSEVNAFLLELYTNKLNKDNLTEKEKENKINIFISKMQKDVTAGENKYDILPKTEMLKNGQNVKI